MEVKKYNHFVVKPLPKTKTKPNTEPKTELEARGLTLENKKIDTTYAKGFVKTSRKYFD